MVAWTITRAEWMGQRITLGKQFGGMVFGLVMSMVASGFLFTWGAPGCGSWVASPTCACSCRWSRRSGRTVDSRARWSASGTRGLRVSGVPGFGAGSPLQAWGSRRPAAAAHPVLGSRGDAAGGRVDVARSAALRASTLDALARPGVACDVQPSRSWRTDAPPSARGRVLFVRLGAACADGGAVPDGVYLPGIVMLMLLAAPCWVVLTPTFAGRRGRARCAACGQELADQPPARCPECSADLAVAGAVTSVQRAQRRSKWIVGMLAAVVVSAAVPFAAMMVTLPPWLSLQLARVTGPSPLLFYELAAAAHDKRDRAGGRALAWSHRAIEPASELRERFAGGRVGEWRAR